MFPSITQSVSTLVVGFAIGIAFSWKLGLVGVACAPLIVSVGYIRLVRHFCQLAKYGRSPYPQRLVVLKDQKNKKEHEASAQLACEAAGAIRTVASLTREQDCCKLYSQSLEEPLQRSNRAALYSNLFWALSQSMPFYVIALIFWYGSRLVASLEYTPFHFFVTLMVRHHDMFFCPWMQR